MRIAVNVRSLTGGRLEGIGRYVFESLKELVASHPEHTFILFFDRKFAPEYIYGPNVIPVIIQPKAIHAVLWYLWFEWRLPFFLKKYKADVFLSPDGFSSTRTKVPTVLVVHDLAYLHYPHFFKRATSLFYRLFVPGFLKKASTIAVVSESTRNDVLSQISIKPDRIFLTHCAASDQFQPLSADKIRSIREKFTKGEPYFFFVGALHPRKNIANLIKAFEFFCRQYDSTIKLVIAGRLAWHSDAIKTAIDDFPFKDRLVYLGSVDAALLPDLMGASFAVVYPSLFEGFGIPILEAMCCDVPVITSNTSSMPEVGGDAALYADPLMPDHIADQMNRLHAEPGLREQLVANGREQRVKFSWKKVAEQLYRAIEKASNR